MTMRRAVALAALACAAAGTTPAAAQSFTPQPQTYMLTTEAGDARSLWVQPAGLGWERQQASIAGMLTLNRENGTSVRQYGATLTSGPLAFGWQHDKLDDTTKTDAFVLGVSGGAPGLTVGFDRRWYKGTRTRDGSWDAGLQLGAGAGKILSIVWRDIGSPVIAGVQVKSTLVPGAAMSVLNQRVMLGADWELVADGLHSSAVRAGATVRLAGGFAVGVRGDFSGSLSSHGFAVSVTWRGRAALVSGFTTSMAAPEVDRTGAWAAAVTRAMPGRPRR